MNIEDMQGNIPPSAAEDNQQTDAVGQITSAADADQIRAAAASIVAANTGKVLLTKETIAAIGKTDPANLKPPEAGSGIFGTVAEKLEKIGKSSGVIGGVVLGTIATVSAKLGGASKTEAAEVFGGTAVPYGATAIEGVKGNIEEAGRAAVAESASNVASIGGAAAGAVIGQILIPVPGVGAAVGAVVGSIAAGITASAIANVAMDNVDKAKNAAKSVSGFFKKLNPFSKNNEDVAENNPARQAAVASVNPVVNPVVNPAERPVEVADNSWDERRAAQFFNPATLAKKGASPEFAQTHMSGTSAKAAAANPLIARSSDGPGPGNS